MGLKLDVLEAIKKRRSIRKYKPIPVSDEKIRRLLEAARLAPSWCNIQPWRFLVIRDPERKKELSKLVGQKHIKEAPVLIACCGDLHAWDELDKRLKEQEEGRPGGCKTKASIEQILKDPFSPPIAGREMMIKRTNEQVMIAIENMLLAATDEGLGTCWVGAFSPERVREFLGIPEHVIVSSLVTMGVPDEEPEQRPRLGLNKIVFHEKWEK